MMAPMTSQSDFNTLSSTDLSQILQVSRATLSRWIARGCPFQEDPHSRKYLFNLNDVENWLNRDDNGKTSRGFPSRRQLKRYWIFDYRGTYEKTVLGSQNAYESLTLHIREDFFRARACAVDASRKEYIAYGGKLRRYNPRIHKDDIEWYECEIEEAECEE